MISYSVAKKLQLAGFKEKNSLRADSKYMLEDGTYIHQTILRDWIPAEAVYAPNLTELIDACGENFGQLVRHYLGVSYAAFSETGHSDKLKWESGKTAEDATGNLWLTLNPKTV